MPSRKSKTSVKPTQFGIGDHVEVTADQYVGPDLRVTSGTNTLVAQVDDEHLWLQILTTPLQIRVPIKQVTLYREHISRRAEPGL